jgi:phosphoribosylformylglycinamidine synthase
MRKGLVQSCHDLSEGGLAVAAAEMAIAGGLGLEIDLGEMPVADGELPDATRLFAESPTRFLIEVSDHDAAAFETLLRRVPHATLGRVLEEPRFRVLSAGQHVVDRGLAELQALWQTPLAEAPS